MKAVPYHYHENAARSCRFMALRFTQQMLRVAGQEVDLAEGLIHSKPHKVGNRIKAK